MSYCRNNGVDSDVYVVATGDKEGNPVWECLGCRQDCQECSETEVSYFSCKTRQAMLWHLLKHTFLGDKVPRRALDRLCEEIAAE